MKFTSTKGMSHEKAPKGMVLVQYLHYSFNNGWEVRFGMALYDSPTNYDDGRGKGWLDWDSLNPMNVLAYAVLPEKLEFPDADLTSVQFVEKYGSPHPNFGNIGV